MKKLMFCLLFCAVSLAGMAQTLNVASYNVRNKNSGDAEKGNGWDSRCPVIVSLIEFHDFDIFGTQEVLNVQLNDLQTALPDYASIGIGRDDGKEAGEYSAIFYKKDKFELLDKGDFWLSTETTFPNKGWDAALPRICSWGKFREKGTGFKFIFLNLHMDHVGVVARRESAKLVLEKVKEMKGKLPVILTGDFNVDQNDEIYEILAHSGILQDSYDIAQKRYATNGTFNNFRGDAFTDSRIDHIFVTPELKVKRYGVLTDSYRSVLTEKQAKERSANFPKEVSYSRYETRVPSDHFPVMVVIEKP